MRRLWPKHAEARALFGKVLLGHLETSHPGLGDGLGSRAGVRAPPEFERARPVGLLLQNVTALGARTNETWGSNMEGVQMLSILGTPIQMLKPQLLAMATQAW
eukprot:2279531-Alexandrium_andersonii.AAC.1